MAELRIFTERNQSILDALVTVRNTDAIPSRWDIWMYEGKEYLIEEVIWEYVDCTHYGGLKVNVIVVPNFSTETIDTESKTT